MEVIREESTRCKTPAPIQAKLQSEVSEIGLHIKKLFAYRYQVLPFIYTHLVSALSTFYLMVTAFLIGLYFNLASPPCFLYACLSLGSLSQSYRHLVYWKWEARSSTRSAKTPRILR